MDSADSFQTDRPAPSTASAAAAPVRSRQRPTAVDQGQAALGVLALLEAFTPDRPELDLGELAQRTGLPDDTVVQLTHLLARQGYLRRDPDQAGVRLGPAVMVLARHFLGARGVRQVARPHMHALSLRFRAAVGLAERDALDMVVLEHVPADSTEPGHRQRRAGSRMPLATTAAGRAWLATAHPLEAAAVRAQLASRFHREWNALVPPLQAAAEDLERLGFTRSYGDLDAEMNSVAVPVHSPLDGSTVFFSIEAPAMVLPARRFDAELGPALVAMAAQVRADLDIASRRG